MGIVHVGHGLTLPVALSDDFFGLRHVFSQHLTAAHLAQIDAKTVVEFELFELICGQILGDPLYDVAYGFVALIVGDILGCSIDDQESDE